MLRVNVGHLFGGVTIYYWLSRAVSGGAKELATWPTGYWAAGMELKARTH